MTQIQQDGYVLFDGNFLAKVTKMTDYGFDFIGIGVNWSGEYHAVEKVARIIGAPQTIETPTKLVAASPTPPSGATMKDKIRWMIENGRG